MTPLAEQVIKDIAQSLPRHTYAIAKKRTVKGSDLLLSGHKEVEGKEIDPEKDYIMKIPMICESNHERRLRRAYKRNKKEGIANYMKAFFTPDNYQKFNQVFTNIQI